MESQLGKCWCPFVLLGLICDITYAICIISITKHSPFVIWDTGINFVFIFFFYIPYFDNWTFPMDIIFNGLEIRKKTLEFFEKALNLKY